MMLLITHRPVSLTCICFKALEHILASNINKPLFAECQHGFHSQRSCKARLVQCVHDIINNLDGAVNRGNIIIINFPKGI